MPTSHEIGQAQARQIIEIVGDAMAARNVGAAVAVVDPHGELVAFLRSDGCPLASINNAINKAFGAAREGVESRIIGERSKADGFPLTNYGDPRYIGWGGGIPLIVDGSVVGAVGVSGLTEAEDVEIARIGVDLFNALGLTPAVP